MFVLLALLLLALTGGVHALALIAARFAVGRFFPTQGKERELSAGFGVARGAAGVAGWYLASSLLIAGALMARGEIVLDETSMRVHVAAGGPAARAGIQDGDRIVTVAGEPITSWDQLKRVVGNSGGDPVAVELDRGGQALTLDVTPEGTPPKMLVGPWKETRSMGLFGALASGLAMPAKVTANTFQGLWRIVTGGEHPEVTGPAGIVKETSSASREGFSAGLMLAALLAAYVLPLVAFASALYELLSRRRD